MTGIEPNLKPVQSGEFTAGLDHELNPTMSLEVPLRPQVDHAAPSTTSAPSSRATRMYLIANPG